jgi:hypothetical protein
MHGKLILLIKKYSHDPGNSTGQLLPSNLKSVEIISNQENY